MALLQVPCLVMQNGELAIQGKLLLGHEDKKTLQSGDMLVLDAA
jgi:hypothetical protein